MGALVDAVRRDEPPAVPLAALGSVFVVMQLLAPLYDQVATAL